MSLCLWVSLTAKAQTDSSNFFWVLDIPGINTSTGLPGSLFPSLVNGTTRVSGQINSDTQLNLFSNGASLAGFNIGDPGGGSFDIETNLLGGTMGQTNIYNGSTVNLNSGIVDGILEAYSGSTINVNGDVFRLGSVLNAYNGSVVRVTDGTIGGVGINGTRFKAFDGSFTLVEGGSLNNQAIIYDAAVTMTGGMMGHFGEVRTGGVLSVSGTAQTGDGLQI